MDHRTIVSFFTCQLVWVNRYAEATSQLSHTLGHTTGKVSDISLQAQTGEQEAQECLQLASSLHQASQQQQQLLSQFRV